MIFKSPTPIVFSLGSIVWSSITAILATLAFFGKMHILTLVFGTSLIGSCIDYSLHYFINWKGNLSCHKGYQVRNHLVKGLFLSSFTLYSKITHKFIEEVFREASVPDDVENYWIDQTIKTTMN